MKIFNLRAGFATNSSSSHSIVILPNSINPDTLSAYGRDGYDFEYGWESFVLTSEEDKLAYFATQLFTSLSRTIDDELVRARMIHEITGFDLVEKAGYSEKSGISAYVDHQSVWELNRYDTESEDFKSFLRDLCEYITKNDRIVIQGGNDNSDWEPDYGGKVKNPPVYDILGEYRFDGYGGGKRIIRKDGDYYTIFSPSTGAKLRFTLKEKAKPYRKSSTPELVDLKITQYCPMGCEFCYQSSTKEGTHASLESIKRYVDRLADMKVMEVAIGGGEPTMHPDFIEILKYIKQSGMVANFTTYSLAWLKNPELVDAVKEYVSAMGVSVHNRRDIEKVIKINKAVNGKETFSPYDSGNKTVIMAQHVFGGTDAGETAQMLVEIWDKSIPLLLLGYKRVGFGVDIEPHDMTDILSLIKLTVTNKNYYGAKMSFLSIDTAFANRFKKFLKEINISANLISSPEGKFSMYIDAVEGQMAPSSYCDKKEYISIPEKTQDIVSIYKKY